MEFNWGTLNSNVQPCLLVYNFSINIYITCLELSELKGLLYEKAVVI